MKKCKNCAYWDQSEYGGNKNKGECRLPRWLEYDEDLPHDSIGFVASAYDDCGLEVEVLTGAEFGCRRFVKRKLKFQTEEAKLISVIKVTDPDTNLEVELQIVKLESGGLVGLDGSFLSNTDNPVYDPYDRHFVIDSNSL